MLSCNYNKKMYLNLNLQSFVQKAMNNSRLSKENVNYLRYLSLNEYFISPWGGLIVKDCEKDTGYLNEYKTIRDYEKRAQGDHFWIYLDLKIFRDTNGNEYPIFVCPKCPCMAAVPSLTLVQPKEDVEQLRCLHSIVSQHLSRETWRQLWEIPNIGTNKFSRSN